MESQLAKLAENNYKLKQLIKEKEESEEKCSKLKGKLNGLKQQVD
jgi:predicted nuclease with TOPRIM domain